MKGIVSLWLVGFFWIAFSGLKAQSFAETALLFSRTSPGGTARTQSMGSTQVALGADISTALSNPAGLGMYNRSEFSITPAFNFASTNSDFLGQSTNDTKNTFHIPNFGIAFHKPYDNESGFLGGTFVISFSRVNDFNRNNSYQATNPNNSIIDSFLETAQGFPSSQFDPGGDLFNTPAQLAFENFLISDSTVIDPLANPNAYFTDVLGIPFQAETIETRGSQAQWSFSYGVNYNDKLFLGAGIGITTLRYESRKTYTESFTTDPLSALLLEENLEITGSGINATFGAIYRPIDFVQVGFSATTPTYYELSDAYNAFMATSWNNFQFDANTLLNDEQFASDLLLSDYSLSTPWKINLGATVFIQKKGFLSLDVEKINYSNANYNSNTPGLSLEADNAEIKSLYQNTFNIRLGGEYRYNAWRFRGGFAYLPEAFKATQNGIDQSVQRLTGGLGYRASRFYVDLAVVHTTGDTPYRPFTVNSPTSPLVTQDQKSTNVLLTVGFPF